MNLVVEQFWSRGFEATSVRDLEAATGLGVTSLYNAFGSKEAMFKTALKHYSERRTGACLRELENLPSPADRIRKFVTRLIDAALEDPDHRGCLIVNTATGLGSHDPEIAEIVARNLGEVKAFFQRNFEAAQRTGEADVAVSPADAARSFSTLMFGLRVLARTKPDRETMEGAVRPLLALLQTKESPLPVDASNPNTKGDLH
ncbi:TetR/AcrR family transcriptional regulator [Loktanella sp. SALINAS62]|uniref:TetR/AcrR family transcriptional regulator n=1 Tax=Loktanella sp. SALINAS62 TaxID=2706124 RepID=UPI001B8C0F58|nr:TetR/AcrR family transcriptional regulator [Loktanella sp. SALINAS62]MBS1303240.1 TetR/AcrR family transcriptional regulator [Loktanella sp. SALINAS62]